LSLYPINLDLKCKKCVVIGGGKVAMRKVKTLLKAQAQVTVIAPSLTASLAELAKAEVIFYKQKEYRSGDMTGFFLAVCATDSSLVNAEAAKEAKSKHILVNVVDHSFPSDFTVPAQVSRGDLLLTVSTGGKSPALARQLRIDLEKEYGDTYGILLDMIEKVRLELKMVLVESKERETFWQQAMNTKILAFVKQGKLEEAEAEVRNAIDSFRSKS